MKYLACDSCSLESPERELSEEGDIWEVPDIIKGVKWRYKSFGADGVAVCEHLNKQSSMHRVLVYLKPANRGSRALPDKYYVGEGRDPRLSN